MKAYFLPGMCVNCKIFDKIILPAGYEKVYIEWLPPSDDPLEEYVRQMAAPIKTDEPFVLIGYSMGGIILQEMNRFLKPEKNILISSMKRAEEIPHFFRFAKKTNLNKRLPKQIYKVNKRVAYLFAQVMLAMSPEETEQCVAYTSAEYLQWAIYHITEWEPKIECENLFHIHGTKDEIFPFRQIKNVFGIEGGNHMMVYRRAEDVNRLIAQLL
ncbi:MAG: alpha/beta hydrolase [Dysgonamonadaceae bacterium]|jgi:surfactin synthase thioesterase subunit|nr:alpha/beta hydrolase [Dysgonamonadaceae bacterium]